MFKQCTDLLVIILLSIAGITHLLRLIYLIFTPKFLEKIKLIANVIPSKTQLILYYILTIAICIYAINIKIGNF